MNRLYPRYNASSADREAPTRDPYVPTVLDRMSCDNHKAPRGIPCFHIPKKDESGYFGGICNTRAVRAGFNNPIRPQSLDRSIGRTSRVEQ